MSPKCIEAHRTFASDVGDDDIRRCPASTLAPNESIAYSDVQYLCPCALSSEDYLPPPSLCDKELQFSHSRIAEYSAIQFGERCRPFTSPFGPFCVLIVSGRVMSFSVVATKSLGILYPLPFGSRTTAVHDCLSGSLHRGCHHITSHRGQLSLVSTFPQIQASSRSVVTKHHADSVDEFSL